MGGKLAGRTGMSDYFLFLCPACRNDQVMRVLEYESRKSSPPVNRGERKTPTLYFNLALHLYCPVCQFEDFIKIDNNHPANRLGEPLFDFRSE
jgi:hypothetical protein